MAVEKIVENIYRIGVPLPGNPLKELNSYLIHDGAHSLLIDTGFPLDECRAALFGGLAELGVAPESVDIFLTHLHNDHTGLAPEIIGPGRTIYMGAVDRGLTERVELSDAPWEERTAYFRRAGFPGETLRQIRTTDPAMRYVPRAGCRQYVTVEDGHVFERGGYRFRCIMTPGHTPGHMCLWEEDRGILFTGDHVLFDITPNITSWDEMEDALGSYLASLEMVRKLPVKLALPSHRKTGDFAARVDELMAHHRARLAETERIVGTTRGKTAYEIAALMTWSIRAKNWDDFPDAQKYFAVGECIAHLDYLIKGGRLRCEERDGRLYYDPVEPV